MSEAEKDDSRKATIAALAKAARGAVAAAYAQSRRHCWTADREPPGSQVEAWGDAFLTNWSVPPEPQEKPGGRIARSVAPLSDLRALGWRIVPLPSLRENHELLAPRMEWWRAEWLAIPPEGSDLRARRFRGPGLAQRWATDMAGLHPGAPCGGTDGG